jgi:transposase-like protein
MVKAGIHHKKAGHYQRFKCQHCGTIRVDFSKDLGWTEEEYKFSATGIRIDDERVQT